MKRSLQTKNWGKFIDSLFHNGEIKTYSADSGTIKNKLEFCKSVIDVTDDFDKLSDEAQILTEKVYEFIKKNNEI